MEKNSVTLLKGIGSQRAERLEVLGIKTVPDLLYHLPRSYLDYSEFTPIREIQDGQTVLVKGTVSSDVRKLQKGKLNIYKFEVIDSEDAFGAPRLSVTLFNRKFVAEKIKKGDDLILYGKAETFGNKVSMSSPDIEDSVENGLCPIYPLTEKITQKTMRKIIAEALDFAVKNGLIEETLPEDIRSEFGLCDLSEAFFKIHKPKSEEDVSVARKRLAFEEILIFRLGLSTLKIKMQKKAAEPLRGSFPAEFASFLPFTMTRAQKKVIAEAMKDMQKPYPMSRVVQGDVGSGKTAVAAALCYYAYKNGGQSAVMVPTEVLAVQHFDDLTGLFAKSDLKVEKLTGSTTKKEKERILRSLESGETDLIVGTHAIIVESVKFKNLTLAVIDEQHRFGVEQRALLSQKGKNGKHPHLLVMSATPIPRSLALIIYGDMDISVIDELPPGRQKVATFLLPSSENARMYRYISDEVKKGRQAYIVCPMVEEGENEEVKAVTGFAKELREKYLPDVKLEVMHGRMKGREKDEILKKFSQNEISVLVSTTVIEVGVNVPNATVMIIQNAERFGLSQLHQLRGRVGRGSEKSYCFLISDAKNGSSAERMTAFCRTNDGFEISRADLAFRGPGEIFGTRQSGLPEFKIADIATDPKLIAEVQDCTEKILADALWFDRKEFEPLKNRVQHFFAGNGGVKL